MLTDDLTFTGSTRSYTGVQYTISMSRLSRKALQLTNSKKESPPHKVHCETTSSQMKARRDSTYGRDNTGLTCPGRPTEFREDHPFTRTFVEWRLGNKMSQ